MKQLAILFLVAISVLGCKKSCVDCSSSSGAFRGKICNNEYKEGAGKEANAPTWPAYRDVLLTSGCKDAN